MVRLHLRDSDSAVAGGKTFIGPLDLVLEEWDTGTETISAGEFVWVDGAPVRVLDHIQEWYFAMYLLIPFALLMGFRSIASAIKR